MYLHFLQDSSVLSSRAMRKALSVHYHALILNGDSFDKFMRYSIELTRGTEVWKTLNSVMQIRQRQPKFKHASETDNKLFLPEYVVYFSVFLLFWLWETKILHSDGWQLAASVLFSDIEGFNLFYFVLFYSVLFSSPTKATSLL